MLNSILFLALILFVIYSPNVFSYVFVSKGKHRRQPIHKGFYRDYSAPYKGRHINVVSPAN